MSEFRKGEPRILLGFSSEPEEKQEDEIIDLRTYFEDMKNEGLTHVMQERIRGARRAGFSKERIIKVVTEYTTEYTTGLCQSIFANEDNANAQLLGEGSEEDSRDVLQK